jgi:hypothetical protein
MLKRQINLIREIVQWRILVKKVISLRVEKIFNNYPSKLSISKNTDFIT